MGERIPRLFDARGTLELNPCPPIEGNKPTHAQLRFPSWEGVRGGFMGGLDL